LSSRPGKYSPAEIPTRPEWIKVKAVSPSVQNRMTGTLAGCNTVCLSAKCPNLGECFSRGVATFMIGGSICTRSCRFCGVRHGRPTMLDRDEPQRVAESVKKLGLKFVVVTSVARDDLIDGGAAHYADTIRAIRERNPGIGIEVLIPDFRGSISSLEKVLDASPDVLNHNVETVRRLTPAIRSVATYERSLEILRISREIAPSIPVKSGLMVGLGESWDEIIETLHDIRDTGCSLITVGQYLQPRAGHEIPVEKYRSPEEFDEIKKTAENIGFLGVASGPFVRSSYFAEQLAEKVNSNLKRG